MPLPSSLMGLACATAFHSLLATSTCTETNVQGRLSQSLCLLVELQRMASLPKEHSVESGAVQSVLDSLDALASSSDLPCDDPALLYLHTGQYMDQSVVLEIEGNAGQRSFTFISGMPMSDIIAAIKSFAADTGVDAGETELNPDRVSVVSVESGGTEFVRVKQTTGDEPIVFYDHSGWDGSFELIDFGDDGILGDFNCDGHVDVLDLMALLQAWGSCAGCPEDLNADGVVDTLDLVILLSKWGCGVSPRRR